MHRSNFNFTKNISILAIGLIAILFFSQFFTSAEAAIGINRQINFQGKLVNNPLSTNVSDTTYTVVFTFYDRESGGTALWQETQSVTTVDGIFRVALGSVTPFPANFNFNWDGLYLGIEINAPTNDPEMTPRIRMAAVPFAFNSEKVAGLTVQDTSGNASTSGTLQVGNAKTISFADNISFGTGTTGTIALGSGSNTLTLATTGNTSVTLPQSGTLCSTVTCLGSDAYWGQNLGALFTNNSTVDLLVGGQSTNSARFKVTANNLGAGTLGVASISGKTSFATLVANNDGVGDLFTASASGWSRFVIKNNGSVGIGTNNPSTKLHVAGGEIRLDTNQSIQFGAPDLKIKSDSSGSHLHLSSWANMRFYADSDNGGDEGFEFYGNTQEGLTTNLIMIMKDTGKIGVNISNPLATFDVRPNTTDGGIISVASISGTTSFAALVANNDGVGDLFTASKSGRSIFTVRNNGQLTLGAPYYTAGCTALETNSAGTLVCGTDDTGGGGVNWWNQLAGALSPLDTTNDFLLGSTSTSSALFSYTGIKTGQTIASVSGSLIVMPNNGYGNVGIGTTNPNYPLVVKSGTAGFAFDALNQNWGTLFGTGGNFGIYAESPGSVTGGYLQMGGSTRGDAQKNAIIFGINNTEYMRIDGNFTGHTLGNVGIGTTTPSQKLHLIGSIRIQATEGDSSTNLISTNATNWLSYSAFGGHRFILDSDSSNGAGDDFEIYNSAISGTPYFSVEGDSGNVGIGTNLPTAPLHINTGYANNAAFIVNNLNNGNLIAGSSSGTTKFVVNSSGNVSIAASSILDTLTAGTLNLGTSTANALVLGNNTVSSQTLNVDTAGNFVFQKEGAAYTCSGTNKLTLNGSGQLVCATDEQGTGVNWWNQLAGALSPLDTTNDFLLGSTSTSSALFSYTGIKTGQTIASASGNLILMANNGWGGKLGIGTTTPNQALEVRGSSIFGNQQASDVTAQPNRSKIIYANELTTETSTDIFATAGSLEVNPGAATSRIYYGGLFHVKSTTANAQNFTGRLVGFQGQVNHSGTATLSQARGFAGLVTNDNLGTITDSFGGRFGNSNTSTGTITNGYGIYAIGGANSGGGTFLNNYGVYIEDQSNAGSTSNYNIYSAGGGSHNFLAGNLGIGTTAVGNGQLVVNQTNFASTGDIFSASAAGTTKFTISNGGNVSLEGTFSDLSQATLGIADDLSVTGTVGSIALQSAISHNTTGDDLSQLDLGDSYGIQGRILLERGAAGAGGDNPSDISFWTVPDTSTTLTERMRIYFDGKIDLGSITTGLRVDSDGGLIDIDDAAIVVTDGLTVSGAIGANGGITFDQATDTLGAFTMAGNIIGGSFIITDIGSTGTDFDTSGGLNITTDAVGTALTVDNAANASSIFVAEDNNTPVFTIADGGNITMTGTLAVNGDSITSDGTLVINSVTATDIQDGLTVDSLTIDTGDITWSGATPTITINAAETFTISNGTAADNFTYNTSTNALTIGDGTNGLTFDIDTGMTYQGSGRPTKKITLNAEYPGAVLTASGSATTNGSMTSDASPSAALSNWRTYYEWNSSQSTLQDYTVVVRVKLPEDFSAWALTNALTISYNTELPGNGSNKMDVVIYNSSTSLTAQEQSTPVVIRTANISASAKTWLDLSIDDSDLNDNGNALNTAGNTAVIYIKMYSKDNNHVQIGDITLSYLSAF